ncbi:MAG: phosphoglucomutase/phosphomannomutase family protein [Nitrospirota bacterium]
MAIEKIQFTGSSWCGILADDFTLPRCRVVSQAIAEHLVSTGLQQKGILIGYDTRFMSERFAEECALICAANGIPVYLSNRDAPIPAITFEINRRKAGCGIAVTAGQQLPYQSGLTLFSESGRPADQETIKLIETQANALWEKGNSLTLSTHEQRDQGLVENVDLRKSYLDDLKKRLDLDSIKKSKLRIAVDLFYGTAREYLDSMLQDAGCQTTIIHGHRDPLFGKQTLDFCHTHPDELSVLLKKGRFDFGIAIDAKAECFRILDAEGSLIQPHQILALILDYLCRTRHWKGGAARSLATSHLIDAVAKKHGIEVYETGMGFKEIGDLLVQGKILFGGEENAGLTVKDHIPEKDGILACMLVAECVAAERKSLKELLKQLSKEVGSISHTHVSVSFQETDRKSIQQRLNQPRNEFGGLRVKGKKTTADGIKYMLEDDSWVLIWIADKEPAARVYAEGLSDETVQALITAGHKIVCTK